MASKEFKATTGLKNWETSENIITAAIITNIANTIDTAPLNSFYSIEYNITIVQGSKIRTSAVLVQTDGTSVDSTEYGIVATGGAISGVAITATASAGNMLLQVTVTDAATTIARVRASRNLLGVIQPYAPGAPVIGTATAGTEQATITFTAPADNGLSAITSYLATSTPGSITGSAASSPITVTGLTGGTTYTFIVQAINAYGISLASASSNSISAESAIPKAIFFAGGNYSGSSRTSVNKILCSNDTQTLLSATLNTASGRGAGYSNSGTAGYVSGGGFWSGGATAENNKFLFSNDSRTVLANALSVAKQECGGAANSGVAGYIGGGLNSGGNRTNVIEKILFSNDSRSTISATLNGSSSGVSGAANSGTAGYFAGVTSSSSTTTYITKLFFSNDTMDSNASWYLNAYRSRSSGMSNNGVAAYWGGGADGGGSGYSSIYKTSYSTNTPSLLSGTLVSNRSQSAGSANSGVAGYIGGEYGNTEKLSFSTETSATLGIALSNSKANPTSFANSGIL